MSFRKGDYVKLEDAGEQLGVSRMTIYRLVEAGKLAATRKTEHGHWFVTRRSLAAYLDRIARPKRPAKRTK